MLLAKGSKLVMIGDSITDVGRARPIGEGRGDALGAGYVKYVDAMLAAWHPQTPVRVQNLGTSGNQARDLAVRWQSDVTDLAPDWLSVLIGINDVWRHFDCPTRPEEHVAIESFVQILDELLTNTRPHLSGLVLLSPYMIEANRADPMRRMMDEFGGVVRKLADRHDAIFVDLQAVFDEALCHMHPYNIAWDRIHPEANGHMMIAKAFLQAVGAL